MMLSITPARATSRMLCSSSTKAFSMAGSTTSRRALRFLCRIGAPRTRSFRQHDRVSAVRRVPGRRASNRVPRTRCTVVRCGSTRCGARRRTKRHPWPAVVPRAAWRTAGSSPRRSPVCPEVVRSDALRYASLRLRGNGAACSLLDGRRQRSIGLDCLEIRRVNQQDEHCEGYGRRLVRARWTSLSTLTNTRK